MIKGTFSIDAACCIFSTFCHNNQYMKRCTSTLIKECMSDSVTNYNYVGDPKISVSIK